MTQEEIDVAVSRLISEANEKIATSKGEWENSVSKVMGRALKNRTARSTIIERELLELKAAYSNEVAKIQQNLDESLNALYMEGETGSGEGDTAIETPYEVDYSLTMRERFIAVKNYYLSYDDYEQAYNDVQKDSVAKDYLGDYYQDLVQMLKMMSIQET